MKIAIVEDDQAIAQMYRIKFENEGYSVQIAEDANEEEASAKKVTKKEEVVAVEDTVSADVESDSLAKSRADLADFDDLDI
jgi:DNA-binding response OmpR family regulator